MKRLLFAAALTCTLLAEAVKVASVAVKADDGREESGDIVARCQVRAGDEYDPAQCQRDVRALRDSGEFDQISVKASEGKDGIDVVYTVKRKMRYQAPLIVHGCEYWNAGKVARFSELRDGYAYSQADLQSAAAKVAREYLKKGFADVKVKPVVTPVPGLEGAVTVTMEITEGERTEMGTFEFDGNESFDAADLRASFGQLPWWNPFGWFNPVPVTKLDLMEARDKVVEFYRNHGYLDAQVDLPKAVPDEKGRVNQLFNVREGALYKVRGFSVKGLKSLEGSAVLGAVKCIKAGDVAGAAKLDEAAHEIEVFCGSGNFALAETRVTVRKTVDANLGSEATDICFVVDEGHPVVINQVRIKNNDYTQDKVIRRQIGLSPGDPMLADKAEKSKNRLENLRYFSRVSYSLEKPLDVPSSRGGVEVRDLVYDVAERDTGSFMVGLGAGSESSVFGQIEISESNFDLFSPWRFRGGGQKGRITVQAGPRIQTYEAAITEPYLFDRELEFTFMGYRRGRWFDDYDIYRSGISAEISYPVKFYPTWEAFGRLGFSLSAEYIEMKDVENDYFWDPARGDSFRMLKEEASRYGDSWEIPLEVFWRVDHRDRYIFPSKGYTAKLYGDVVGGDNEYWRVGFNFSQYITTWQSQGHVFMWRLRGDTVDAFNGGLPIYDRLFLGGSKSIRGVDFREIAPRIYARENKKGHYAAWGGQTSWCMNMEYSVPIVKMLRFAVFSDLGSVGRDEFDFDTDWFCWSVGLGLRVDIEQFPIRLDFAVPVVDPDEDVDEKVFSFSIGYDF